MSEVKQRNLAAGVVVTERKAREDLLVILNGAQAELAAKTRLHESSRQRKVDEMDIEGVVLDIIRYLRDSKAMDPFRELAPELEEKNIDPESMLEMTDAQIEKVLQSQYVRELEKWRKVDLQNSDLMTLPSWDSLKLKLDGGLLNRIRLMKKPRLLLTPWKEELSGMTEILKNYLGDEAKDDLEKVLIDKQYVRSAEGVSLDSWDRLAEVKKKSTHTTVGGFDYNSKSSDWGVVIAEAFNGIDDGKRIYGLENMDLQQKAEAYLNYLKLSGLQGINDLEALSLHLGKSFTKDLGSDEDAGTLSLLLGQVAEDSEPEYRKKYYYRPRTAKDPQYEDDYHNPAMLGPTVRETSFFAIRAHDLKTCIPVLRVNESGEICLEGINTPGQVSGNDLSLIVRGLVRLK